MRLIDREEPRQNLDGRDDFKLVIVLGDWAYRTKHIPGSLNLYTIEKVLEALDTNDEIIVYCSNPDCVASVAVFRMLTENGYGNSFEGEMAR